MVKSISHDLSRSFHATAIHLHFTYFNVLGGELDPNGTFGFQIEFVGLLSMITGQSV
jgi:hypothetical protein